MRTLYISILIVILGATSIMSRANNEIRTVDSFNKLSLRIGANVYIEQGDKQIVEISASAETISKIITEIDNSTLTIRYTVEDRLLKKWNPGPISIRIVSPEYKRLSVSGSGDIVAQKLIESSDIELNISGSGNINLVNLETKNVKVSISGSGNIFVAGRDIADTIIVSIAGSGSLKASSIQTKFAKVSITGSGNCMIHAIDNLYARIVGSGNVKYTGNPNIDAKSTGSGRVIGKRKPETRQKFENIEIKLDDDQGVEK